MYINYTHLFSLFICFCLSKSYQVTTFQSRAPCALVEEGLDQWLHSGWWRLESRYHRSARRTSVGWEGHGAQKVVETGGGWNWYGSMPLGFSETDGQEQEEKYGKPQNPLGYHQVPNQMGNNFGRHPPVSDRIPHSQGVSQSKALRCNGSPIRLRCQEAAVARTLMQ